MEGKAPGPLIQRVSMKNDEAELIKLKELTS